MTPQAAGVFTTNQVQAPCVVSNQTHLQDGLARAIVVNSGNANACNGEQGWTDAVAMVNHAAEALGLPHRRVLSASTGVIGHALPMEKIVAGIQNAATKLHGDTCDDAAQAIMTTDTFPKQVAVEFTAGRQDGPAGGHRQRLRHDRAEHGDHARPS